MNRQVIPSMILSVLFVCFFSVLLYEREKPAIGWRTARVEGKPETRARPRRTRRAPVETASARPAVPAPEAPSPKAAEPPPASPPVISEQPSPPADTGPSPPKRISHPMPCPCAVPHPVADRCGRLGRSRTRPAAPENPRCPRHPPPRLASGTPLGFHHRQGRRVARRHCHPRLRLRRPGRRPLAGQPRPASPTQLANERRRRPAYARGMSRFVSEWSSRYLLDNKWATRKRWLCLDVMLEGGFNTWDLG